MSYQSWHFTMLQGELLQLWQGSEVFEMLRCVRWSIMGCLLGLATVAWAQAEPVTTIADPSTAALIELVKSAGLPGVLAAVGWWLRGLAQTGLALTVRIDEDDREFLRNLLHRNHQ